MNVAERHRMDRTERKKVGLRLKEARKSAGMTGQSVAQTIHLAQHNTVYIYESGKSLPSLQVFAALCRLYNVPMDDVWFGKNHSDTY
jgi:DNA-binding XRE family transcriptional regulator